MGEGGWFQRSNYEANYRTFTSHKMANIFLVFHMLLLFYSPKGSWNNSAKYEKLRKYLSYCTRNRVITNAYFSIIDLINWIVQQKCEDLCHESPWELELKKITLWPLFMDGVRDPLQGVSLLFTIKSPGAPGTHLIDLERIKGWVDLGTTQWFWTQDPWDFAQGRVARWLQASDFTREYLSGLKCYFGICTLPFQTPVGAWLGIMTQPHYKAPSDIHFEVEMKTQWLTTA